MSTDIDWQHELDSSFGVGRDVPVGAYVAAGRSAVRRRRIAACAATAVIAVAGGAAWASSPGSSVRGDAPVATRGAMPQQDDVRRDRGTDRQRPTSEPALTLADFSGNPAVLRPDGTVEMSPLAGKVLQRLPNPMGYTSAQGMSVALRVRYEGSEKYSFMSLTQDGTSLSTTTHDPTGDFAGWVAGVAANQRTLDVMNGVLGSSGPDDDTDPATWLEMGPDGAPVPTRPGVVPVEVRTDVYLGEGFARATDRTGAMRLLVDGTSRVVAYRVVDGELDVISGPGRFDSLRAFLTWARSQYAAGEGVR